MGADLLLCSLPACTLTPERKAEVENLIAALPEEEAREIADSMCWLDEDEGEGDEDFPETRQHLRDALEVYETLDDTPYRALCRFGLPGLPYDAYFTGGMSWGDSPTDLFDDFQALDCCGTVCAALERFAREDYQASVKAAAKQTSTTL